MPLSSLSKGVTIERSTERPGARTPGRSIDLHDDVVDVIAETKKLPNANMTPLEDKSRVRAISEILGMENAGRSTEIPNPSSPPGRSNSPKGGFMDVLVHEIVGIKHRVSRIERQEPREHESLGKRTDKVAKMVIDLRAGSERLLDEIASLREAVDRYERGL